MACDWLLCTEQANTVIVVGCMRMHVYERYYCPGHAGTFKALVNAGMSCKLCAESGIRQEKVAEYLASGM
jgi:hypothetical protein